MVVSVDLVKIIKTSFILLEASTLNVLALKTRWQTLRQFLCLLSISNNEGVQMSWAPNLEFSLSWALANFHELGISPTSFLEEVANISDLLRHVYSLFQIKSIKNKRLDFNDSPFTNMFSQIQFNIPLAEYMTYSEGSSLALYYPNSGN